MNRAIAWCWKWSWLVTLPASLLFLQWFAETSNRYHTFCLRYDSSPIKIKALDLGKMEFLHLQRSLKNFITQPTSQSSDRNSLKKIHLFVPEANISQLNSNLPHSGFEYVEGGLLQGDRVQDVKVKYRGDTALHWAYYKKSTRVKTKKKSLFEGMRTFNLIAPKFDGMIHNHLALRLASLLGLLAPRSEMVDLTLNGKPTGVFNLVEQLDEGTLRRNGRMPGDIYAGEWVGRDNYQGVSGQVFLHPKLWEKSSINNHYAEESKKPLEKLIMLLNTFQNEQSQAELGKLLDMEAWGKFSALELLIQSFHYDSIHNWRLYYDPWRTQFEPVVWDPVGWHPSWLPSPGAKAHMDIVITRLHEVLFQNGDFLRARQQAIDDFFNSGTDKQFLEETDGMIAAMIPAIEHDPNLIKRSTYYIEAIRRLRSDIGRTFADVRQEFLSPTGSVTFTAHSTDPTSSKFAFLVEGRRPVHEIQLSFASAIETPTKSTLGYWASDRFLEQDISAALATKGPKIVVSTSLLPRYVPTKAKDPQWRDFVKDKKENQMKIEPAYYELTLKGVRGEHEVLEVLVDRGNGLEPALAADDIEKKKFGDNFSIAHSQPIRLPTIWADTVEIEGIIEVRDELIIRPGTVVRLHPGASLIIHNRLLAQGTTQRPIRFLPANEGQEPWGTVALKGRGADRSRIANCEFAGGSGLKSDTFEYSAMFSIHEVEGVEVRDSLFRESQIVDDMVHAVYSKVRFTNSTFRDALFDAVDIDISSAFLEGCIFSRSGNDALDLMTSEVTLVDTLLKENQDKGVSIGEGSSLLAINNRFVANAIGVQAKDSSVVTLYNTEFIKNNLALDAYKKNWRYGSGGEVFLYKGSVLENSTMITADKHSAIWIHDTYLDKELDGHKSIKLDETVDSSSPKTARIREAWLFPNNKSMHQQFEEYQAFSNPGVRGASEEK